MRALALDFDGVLCESAGEAFAVALRAHAALHPQSPIAAHAAAPDAAASDPLRAFFLQAMPLGNRAEDYGAVLEASLRGLALPDQAAYDAFRAHLDPAFLDAFHARFYEERADWRTRDPEGWRARLRPYPGLLAALRRRGPDLTLAIVTAKDAASVNALLQDWGVADLFAPEHVLDKETGVSKRAHLQALRERLGLDFAAITFVDDKLNHLESVAPLGVRCALAAWGYNGERERRAARAAGFTVTSLERFEAELVR